MGNWRPRAALWGLVALLLASVLVSVPGAWAGSSDPNYQITGTVYEPGPVPVPSGVTVNLESQASHQIISSKTYGSGLYAFNSSVNPNAPSLAPGFWGLWVPPQAKVLGGRGSGCNPVLCAVLPTQQSPTWYWENATSLTTTSHTTPIGNVTTVPYDSWIFGNVTNLASGKPVASASVQLLAPTYNGLVLANATTNRTGSFNFSAPTTTGAPTGRWILQTTALGAPGCTACNSFNYTAITGLSQSRVNLNVVVGNYLTYGWVYQAAHPTVPVQTGGNVTLFDPTNGYIYSQPTPPGGFYSIGTYPAGFSGVGAQTFTVVLGSVGYGTTSYPLTVSGGNPTGGTNPRSNWLPTTAPPAVYNTTLDFSAGFSNLTVKTVATLGNYSTVPTLPNASVGQLWAQLGLDFQQSLSFNTAGANGLPALFRFLNSTGPFFPAGQALMSVSTSTPTSSSVAYNESLTAVATQQTACSGTCGLTTAAGLNYTWNENYAGHTNGTLATNQRSYTMTFVFRHPTHAESLNYTVTLPNGYVLAANAPAPAQTRLIPAGPGGTWTNFTLVSQPSSSPFGTATFTIVKHAAVTPIVNATVANFAFSTKNVLNSSRGNYTVIVGTGENVTFTSVNSTFPAGTNGTKFQWDFGDGSGVFVRSVPTIGHTFQSSNAFHGTFTLTSSGGLVNSTKFNVYSGATPPVAGIVSNASASQRNHTAAGTQYLTVTWGSTIRFNASNSSSVIFPGANVSGVISIASFNLSAGPNYWHANYSAGMGAKPFSDFTYTFLGAGPYLSNGTVNGTLVPFKGWQYNLTLTVWDGGGHKASTRLAVLVKDTQKPVPSVNVGDINGVAIPSSGVTEQKNFTAFVRFNASGSNDPHNGSIVQYFWNLTNTGNSSFNLTKSQAPAAGGGIPAAFGYWLSPAAKAYRMNLTVTDRAGNKNYNAVTFVVAFNQTNRPQLTAQNLSAPTSATEGSSYTVWVNVTNILGGKNSTAENVTVNFYLLPPSGGGSRVNVGGSPGSVSFYNYSSEGVVNSTPWASGASVHLGFNRTIRAQIQWSPNLQGTYDLWANATASNEPSSDYTGGANAVHVSVQLNPNQTTLYIEIGAAVGAAAAIIVVLVILYRRGKMRSSSRGGSKSSSSGKGSKPSKSEDDEDEEP